MATFYSDIATIQNDPLQISNKRTSGLKVTGNVQCAVVQYTTDGTEVDGDLINLVKLPPGVIIDPNLSSVFTSATLDGSAVTLDIGDDATWTHLTPDVDRYMDGVDVTTATEVVFFNAGTAVSAANGTPYKTTKEGYVTATINASSALNASAVLTFRIYYTAIS